MIDPKDAQISDLTDKIMRLHYELNIYKDCCFAYKIAIDELLHRLRASCIEYTPPVED